MSYKKYLILRMLGVIIIALIVAWANVTGNLLVMIPAVLIVGILLFAFKKRVKEVIVDERVLTVTYRASRLAFVIFVALAAVAGITLTYLAEDSSDVLLSVGVTISYSACALLLIYWAAYAYYNRRLGGKE